MPPITFRNVGQVNNNAANALRRDSVRGINRGLQSIVNVGEEFQKDRVDENTSQQLARIRSLGVGGAADAIRSGTFDGLENVDQVALRDALGTQEDRARDTLTSDRIFTARDTAFNEAPEIAGIRGNILQANTNKEADQIRSNLDNSKLSPEAKLRVREQIATRKGQLATLELAAQSRETSRVRQSLPTAERIQLDNANQASNIDLQTTITAEESKLQRVFQDNKINPEIDAVQSEVELGDVLAEFDTGIQNFVDQDISDIDSTEALSARKGINAIAKKGFDTGKEIVPIPAWAIRATIQRIGFEGLFEDDLSTFFTESFDDTLFQSELNNVMKGFVRNEISKTARRTAQTARDDAVAQARVSRNLTNKNNNEVALRSFNK